MYKEEWVPVAAEAGHPLGALDGLRLAKGQLRVRLGPSSRFGARYFRLHVLQPGEKPGDEPLLFGLHNNGSCPTKCWVEILSAVRLPPWAVGQPTQVERRLLQLMAAILPPGGALMVEYESQERRETDRGLILGLPPVTTPIGLALLDAGCYAHYKDWYFSEGGNEGPRKLQATKPVDDAHARKAVEGIAAELLAFLRRPPCRRSPEGAELEAAARVRARTILRRLPLEDPLLVGQVASLLWPSDVPATPIPYLPAEPLPAIPAPDALLPEVTSSPNTTWEAA